MTQENQRGWLHGRRTDGTERRSPTGFFNSPDTIQRSNRSVAGPLRTGTAPGAGPRGAPPAGSSDFEMDRLEHRAFDHIGQKYPQSDPKVGLISKEVRRSRKDE